jgi:hypothetical protein
MKTTNEQLDRREFLKKASQAAATVAVSAGMASAAAPEERKSDPADAIASRVLGKTGLKWPILPVFGAAAVVFAADMAAKTSTKSNLIIAVAVANVRISEPVTF